LASHARLDGESEMKKNLVCAATLLACILLVTGCSPTEAPRHYQVPQELDDGWQTAAPESVGLDREKIEALVQGIRGDSYANLHSVLVVKDGKLVLEEYAHGSHGQRKHDVASVTKSITSILIGIALDQGAIAGPDQPLAELLPAYADLINADPAKSDLKLWHILTMTSGFEWDEQSQPYGHADNDATRMQRSADPVRFVLERPIVHRPGTNFQYSGANSMLLSAIIKEQTGMQAHAFAKPHLFEPLGISGTRWDLYANALTDTDGGLSLRARDMAKIGLLYLDGGRWNGEQVVPQSWVKESTQAHVSADAGADYGYQWWRTGVPVGLRSVDTYFASGFGGQAIHVFPELDLVVVFTNVLAPGSGNAMQNLAMLSGYVLPAALPADGSDLLVWLWPVLAGLSLLGLLWSLARSRPWPLPVWLSWTWIVLVYGPLGFAAYRLSTRGTESSGANWRRALGPTLFCASGNAAGFCLLFALFILLQPQGAIILPAFLLPLLTGWLIFRAPAFAHQAGGGYLHALRRTLLAEVITTLLVLAGMLPAIILLQTRWFPIGNFDVTNPLLWLMVSLSAMAGAIFAYPFNYWLARRGFLIWPGPGAVEGKAGQAMPSLRTAWWALLLSAAVLVGSMALAVSALF
jgi:CubicO group peptidase (beta-lactamase class C family)